MNDPKPISAVLHALPGSAPEQPARKQYTAVALSNMRIVTVTATTDDEARAEITAQLDRNGRRPFLEVWINGGRRMEVTQS